MNRATHLKVLNRHHFSKKHCARALPENGRLERMEDHANLDLALPNRMFKRRGEIVLNTTQADPQSVLAILAAVRCMATLTGDSYVSLRISLSGEECKRCRRVSELFVEPIGVCTVCWSILVLNAAVGWLKEPFKTSS
jgi:hypothetical protein